MGQATICRGGSGADGRPRDGGPGSRRIGDSTVSCVPVAYVSSAHLQRGKKEEREEGGGEGRGECGKGVRGGNEEGRGEERIRGRGKLGEEGRKWKK